MIKLIDILKEITINKPGKPTLHYLRADGGGTTYWKLGDGLLTFNRHLNKHNNYRDDREDIRSEFMKSHNSKETANTIKFLNLHKIPWAYSFGGGLKWFTIKDINKYFYFDKNVDYYGNLKEINVENPTITPEKIGELMNSIYEKIWDDLYNREDENIIFALDNEFWDIFKKHNINMHKDRGKIIFTRLKELNPKPYQNLD
jgi:hypothetical protein